METYGSLFAINDELGTRVDYPGLFMVDEFFDVFPEELFEFCINLVPGAQPISLPPYRMVPSNLTELMK